VAVLALLRRDRSTAGETLDKAGGSGGGHPQGGRLNISRRSSEVILLASPEAVAQTACIVPAAMALAARPEGRRKDIAEFNVAVSRGRDVLPVASLATIGKPALALAPMPAVVGEGAWAGSGYRDWPSRLELLRL
jgi:hypothetical protein